MREVDKQNKYKSTICQYDKMKLNSVTFGRENEKIYFTGSSFTKLCNTCLGKKQARARI